MLLFRKPRFLWSADPQGSNFSPLAIRPLSKHYFLRLLVSQLCNIYLVTSLTTTKCQAFTATSPHYNRTYFRVNLHSHAPNQKCIVYAGMLLFSNNVAGCKWIAPEMDRPLYSRRPVGEINQTNDNSQCISGIDPPSNVFRLDPFESNCRAAAFSRRGKHSLIAFSSRSQFSRKLAVFLEESTLCGSSLAVVSNCSLN